MFAFQEVGMTGHEVLVTNVLEALDAIQIHNHHIMYLDNWKPDKIIALFNVADLMQEVVKEGCNLLQGRMLYNLFYQPSTRTKTSYEYAMKQLGGQVINECNPLQNSAATRGESLHDTLRVISEYADIVVLRHADEQAVIPVLENLGSCICPIISGGLGHTSHPTQALSDMYTVWRMAKKPFKELKVLISSPDLSKGARTGHSFALGMAKMGAKIIYTGTQGFMIPSMIRHKLLKIGAKFEEYSNLNKKQNLELLTNSDLVYMPITSLASDDPNRKVFLSRLSQHYISLNDLQTIKKRTGKIIGAMHPLPRNDNQFDSSIDDTEFELYFKTVKLSVPLRMVLISAVIGIPLHIQSK